MHNNTIYGYEEVINIYNVKFTKNDIKNITINKYDCLEFIEK